MLRLLLMYPRTMEDVTIALRYIFVFCGFSWSAARISSISHMYRNQAVDLIMTGE
jgi:hypothetical protein